MLDQRSPRFDNLHGMLDATAELYAGSVAVDFMGRRWTYGEIAEEVRRVARGLQAIGVEKGDRVGLCLPNTPYSVIAYYAVLKVGAVVVNYNPLYVARELEHQIRDSGTKAMFVIDVASVYANLVKAAENTGLRTIVLCRLADVLPRVKGMLYRLLKREAQARPVSDARHVDWASLRDVKSPPRPVVVSGDDTALLQYTGGTTGVPKGAVLTHDNLLANTRQIVAHDLRRRPGEERVLSVIPLFHVFAMTVVLNYAVRMAAEMVLLPRYDLATTLKAILSRRPTVFPAVPTIYGAIAKLAEAERHDLSFIKQCISGGAPLPHEIGEAFRRVTGAPLVEGYGLTECSPVVTSNPADGSGKAGSIGLPLIDTIVEIRDPVTRELMPAGEKGELVVRGPQVMRGYWNKPEETAAVLDQHGLRTGDIGYRDEDGYIFIVDRIKDIILSSGYNVYPRTIEDALYQHADVLEAVVIGVPDGYRGHSAKAFVVLRAGSMTTPETLSRFVETHLSKIERPKTIEIRAHLPKTAVGKLSRKELVAEEEVRRSHTSAASPSETVHGEAA